MFSFHFAPTVSDTFLTSTHASHPPPGSAHGIKIPLLLKAQARLGTGHGLNVRGTDKLWSFVAAPGCWAERPDLSPVKQK